MPILLIFQLHPQSKSRSRLRLVYYWRHYSIDSVVWCGEIFYRQLIFLMTDNPLTITQYPLAITHVQVCTNSQQKCISVFWTLYLIDLITKVGTIATRCIQLHIVINIKVMLLFLLNTTSDEVNLVPLLPLFLTKSSTQNTPL